MFLLVPAHPGCPGQNPQSRKTVVCVCVCVQDDSLQLLKEERRDGAIYDIYVKKVNYHTSVNERISARNSDGSRYANSTFYTELPVQLLFFSFSVFGI